LHRARGRGGGMTREERGLRKLLPLAISSEHRLQHNRATTWTASSIKETGRGEEGQKQLFSRLIRLRKGFRAGGKHQSKTLLTRRHAPYSQWKKRGEYFSEGGKIHAESEPEPRSNKQNKRGAHRSDTGEKVTRSPD